MPPKICNNKTIVPTSARIGQSYRIAICSWKTWLSNSSLLRKRETQGEYEYHLQLTLFQVPKVMGESELAYQVLIVRKGTPILTQTTTTVEAAWPGG